MTLLAYNLTCLYAYNQRDRDLTAFDIGWKRSVAVIIGLVWAHIVCSYWWPYAARKELRIGLSDFCIDLSYLYAKLVSSYSGKDDGKNVEGIPGEGDRPQPKRQATETTSLLDQGNEEEAVLKQFLSM